MAHNIIFYFTDQQRWDTCGCFGQPLDITPNLDQLAREGAKFDNAFSPQPVCGPCRALFQTGKYPTETGCFRNNIMLPAGVNGGAQAASDVYADDFLYDLKADPWQLNNVVAEPSYHQVKAELRERLLAWIEKAEGCRPTIID